MSEPVQAPRALLKCSGCGLAVVQDGDKLIRACICDAPVIAELTATLKAHGGLQTN